MTGSLNQVQTRAYQDDGFLFPIRVMDEANAADYRRRIEAVERDYAGDPAPLRHPLNTYMRQGSHYVLSLANQLSRDPAILDAVESILGPDLLAWSVEFFIKEAGTSHIVSWHQDLTYWGLGETDEEVTAWLALSPATVESGCMKFVGGSHKNAIVPHNDTFDDNNLLSRGQEIAVDVAEDDAVDVALQPGEMSLHHGRMFHASGPNVSDDRRVAFVVRYITPQVRQHGADQDFATLVRGANTTNHFTLLDGARSDFEPAALDTFDRVFHQHAQVLGAGAEQEMNYVR